MSYKAILAVAGLAGLAALLPACGGSDAAKPTALAPTQIKMETSVGILAMAKDASETSDPLIVGTDAIAPADLDDETSDPIPVG